MSLEELTASIWRQRDLLGELERRLVNEQLLMELGRSDLGEWANGHVLATLDELRVLELHRAALSDRVAAAVGLPAGASLASIAAVAPEPWDQILDDHRRALNELVRAVQLQAARNGGQLPESVSRSRTVPSQESVALAGGDLIARAQ